MSEMVLPPAAVQARARARAEAFVTAFQGWVEEFKIEPSAAVHESVLHITNLALQTGGLLGLSVVLGSVAELVGRCHLTLGAAPSNGAPAGPRLVKEG